jgi:hypothetical protein
MFLHVFCPISWKIYLPFTIRKCDFLKGPTWLKCPYWLKGMVILIKDLGHEGSSHFWFKHLTKVTLLTMHVTNQTFGQKNQGSIKMTKA